MPREICSSLSPRITKSAFASWKKIIDADTADLERGAVYGGCRAEVQGVSVGYGDAYVAQLYEQDINISRVPDGNYALVTTANPERAIEETDYENNAAIVYLALKDGQLVGYPLNQ